MKASLTPTQRAILEALADREWHERDQFNWAALRALYRRGFAEQRTSGWSKTAPRIISSEHAVRITDAGLDALGKDSTNA